MGLEFWKWRPYKVRLLVSNSIYAKRIEMALPVPTKSLLKMSPDAAMLFAPFDRWFLTPFMPKRIEMALPVPTKSLLKMSPDVAMLFAPFGCTHPPSPVLPFLLTQNLSPKDIAGSDIMKLKVS